MTFTLTQRFCNGWSSCSFGSPYFIATFSDELVKCTHDSSTVQILQFVLWVNSGYILSNLRAIKTQALFCYSVSKWGIPLAATRLTPNFFFKFINADPVNMPIDLATRRVASCINRQQVLHLGNHFRVDNTCRHTSTRGTVNSLYSRLEAFYPPGYSWICQSNMPISEENSVKIALAFILSLNRVFKYPLISALGSLAMILHSVYEWPNFKCVYQNN